MSGRVVDIQSALRLIDEGYQAKKSIICQKQKPLGHITRRESSQRHTGWIPVLMTKD